MMTKFLVIIAAILLTAGGIAIHHGVVKQHAPRYFRPATKIIPLPTNGTVHIGLHDNLIYGWGKVKPA